MKTILFVCSYNSCRSQMAEGIASAIFPKDWAVLSAGVFSSVVNETAMEILKEKGIDISNQRSKTIDDLGGIDFDVVVTLCDSAKEQCPNLKGRMLTEHWGIKDPVQHVGSYDEHLAEFRRVRDEIEEKIGELLEKLAE